MMLVQLKKFSETLKSAACSLRLMTYTLLTEWENEARLTRKILERVPQDKLSWKPHEKSSSLGDLAMHVASLLGFAEAIITKEEIDFAGEKTPPPKDREEIIAKFDALNERMVELLSNPIDMDTIWTFKVKGHTVISAPRSVAMRSFFLSHLIHHRGQLSVYLRLLDVPVPGLYGPSADER